jgi:hypothetical protein
LLLDVGVGVTGRPDGRNAEGLSFLARQVQQLSQPFRAVSLWKADDHVGLSAALCFRQPRNPDARPFRYALLRLGILRQMVKGDQ